MEEYKKAIICHFCNKENDLDGKYCSECGKPTKQLSENLSEEELFLIKRFGRIINGKKRIVVA